MLSSVGGVLPGREATAEIGVGVTEGFSSEKIHLLVPKGAPFKGEVRRDRDGTSRLALTWLGATEPGWHRHTLQLEPKRSGNFLATPVQVAVQIIPAVQVFPESLWLRDAEVGASWTRRVTVRRALAAQGELGVVVADKDVSKALLIRLSPGDAGENVITLSPRSSGAMAPFKGRKVEILLTVAGATVEKIPLTLGDPLVVGPKGVPPSGGGSK